MSHFTDESMEVDFMIIRFFIMAEELKLAKSAADILDVHDLSRLREFIERIHNRPNRPGILLDVVI
jgi:hypothetical protein